MPTDKELIDSVKWDKVAPLEPNPRVPNFGDRPDTERLRIRWLIEDVFKGKLASYNGPSITVAMPSTPDKHGLIRVIELLGFRTVEVSWFPIGGDNPPTHLRHQMHKWGFDDPPGSFYLYYKFRPVSCDY